MPRLSPGESVDRYVVEKVLGDGGMAVVYLVRHVHLGSRHALKVLSHDLLGNAGIRDRFLAEGRIQAQLAHPNVARVTDVVSEPGVAALVVEYIAGPTLDEWLEGKDGGSAADILSIFLPVLDAVEAAHKSGVLHRDLKPSNIILGEGVGGAIRPVVLDFGIAAITADTEIAHGRRSRTRTGAQLGTPAYMSPEQVRNQGVLDGRTDIFSLGAILYELATGRVAFEAENDYDTLSNVVGGTYQAPEPIAGDTAGLIGDCIQRALAVDRQERFADVPAFRAALLQATQRPEASGPGGEFSRIEDIGDVAFEEQSVVAWAEQVLEKPPIPEFPPPLPQEEEGAAVEVRTRKRIWKWPLLLLLGLVLAGAGLYGMRVMQAQAETDAARHATSLSMTGAAAALATLELRQTDPGAHADRSIMERAVRQAKAAVAEAKTPEAQGALAFASVLQGGWHLRSRRWNEAEFKNIEQLTREAFSEKTRPETALARAIVEARACRLLPKSDSRRERFCSDGLARFKELDVALATDKRQWLRVDLGWMAAGFVGAFALEQQKAGDLARADQLGSEALRFCDSAAPALGKGSVNDGVLRTVCLVAAGRSGALREYFRWARILRTADEVKYGGLSEPHTRLVFTSVEPTSCKGMGFGRTERGRTTPQPEGGSQRYCAAVGYYALDCPAEARAQALAGKVVSLKDGSEHPWMSPEFAWSRSEGRDCYLGPGGAQ